MADVHLTPRVRCDNCGFTEDMTVERGGREWRRPLSWGSARVEGAKNRSAYGSKDNMAMADLCPRCAHSAFEAVSAALGEARKEPSS